jgi:hypothetical protein
MTARSKSLGTHDDAKRFGHQAKHDINPDLELQSKVA